ncbi:hypothetical protein [Serratia phage vB_SspM_LC53]|nr:hypothetical protein [Serratia phage vB_SspM_LC53]
MALQTNSFVSSPEYLSKIKCTQLRKLMMLGACLDTPLEKKATFNYTWTRTDKGDMVTQVTFYSPNSNIPDKVFNLNGQTYIPLSDWYRIMSSVNDYPFFIEEVTERKRIRDIVKHFEESAKRHGQMQQATALGDVSENSAYETGKILKEARRALYDELDIL